MAEELPAGTPEVDSPLLVADLLRLLNVKGAIGHLQLADIVIPTVSLGDVVTPSIDTRTPSFRSTDVFTAGLLTGSPAATIHADTGPLPAGVYDLSLYQAADATAPFGTEHRNAANTVALAVWATLLLSGANNQFNQLLGYELADNERIRISNVSDLGLGVFSTAWIFARRRS